MSNPTPTPGHSTPAGSAAEAEAEAEHVAGEPVGMSHKAVMRAMSGIFLGLFVSLLSNSIISSSLPRIISDLDGTQSAFTWVVTATLLTTTISTPIWGKVADLVNRKLLIQLSLVITVLSAALAGMAQDTSMLILWRAFQGIGAGGLTAVGMVLIADIVAARERGKYMGYMGAVMAVATIGAPLLGGALTDTVGWRWNFYIAVPFAIVAIIVLQRTLVLPKLKIARVRLDYWGALLISAGISGLLLWVTFAGSNFDWASWQSFTLAGAAVLALVAAVWVESRVEAPIIPLSLFRNRTVTLAIVASLALGVVLFGTTVFLSQYMQIARGYSPTVSGLLTVPLIVGQLASSIVVGQLVSRTGRYKVFLIVGAAIMPAGLALMSTIDYQTNLGLISIYMMLIGVGMGMVMQNIVLAAQNTLTPAQLSTGSSTIAFFRSLGGALGVSILGAILGSRVTSEIGSALKATGIDGSPLAGGAIPNVSTLPGPLAQIVEAAYGVGVAELFLIAAPIALISLIAVIFVKEVPLSTKSNIQVQLEELAKQQAADDAAREAARSAEAPGETQAAHSDSPFALTKASSATDARPGPAGAAPGVAAAPSTPAVPPAQTPMS